MSNYTKSLNETTLLSLLKELDSLSKAVQSLKEKVLKLMPAKYGSDLWWEKSNEEAIEQIRNGKGVVIKNQEELKRFFNL